MKGRRPPPKQSARNPGPKDPPWLVASVCLALATITFAVFGQTLSHGFIDFDDNDYVYNNPRVARGLTLKGLRWAFTNVHSFNWHPLTWISHMFDCQVYGLRPGGHHLTSVLIHAATAVLLFLVLRTMTGALWRCAFVAAVFAIHPLRVESVAWVAERKDVLSGLFFVLTIAAYVRYARPPRSAARYGMVLLLFAFGLMSKPMLVTLPAVLLLLDYWPLRRMEAEKFSRLLLEKLPLVALALVSCAITFWAQAGAIQADQVAPLSRRLDNALVSCVIYLRQLFWPGGLAIYYPYSQTADVAWQAPLAGMFLVALAAVAVWQRRQRPWLLIGWLWYLAMLLPVIGIIQVGGQAHADRYTYLPQIGLCLAFTWLIAEWRWPQMINAALMAVIIAVLMGCAGEQAAYWKDSESLWTHALACTTKNDVAQNSLGKILYDKGNLDGARAHEERALQINPRFVAARINLGNTFLQMGEIDEAIPQFNKALELSPDDPEAHNGLGTALFQNGRSEEAITQFEQALKSKPDSASAHNNLGRALLQTGRFNEAIQHFQEALKIDPALSLAHLNYGIALSQEGKLDQAISQYYASLALDSKNADAHVCLALASLQKGNAPDGIAQLKLALQLDPKDEDAENDLGNALLQTGDAPGAAAHFQNAVQLKPRDPNALNNLAWLLATSPDDTLRDGSKAVSLATRAADLTSKKNPIILHTLAAAYANVGRFSDALQTTLDAIRLAQEQSNSKLNETLQAELEQYEANKPLRMAQGQN